ncbi:hypothetical protein LTS18_003846 [Coniosporium uncinatum]|uniref:Uncharacterized protein n=1 Tax=Coniosporium uncinatum TaxID=93489 RepID=A0ACC3DBF1_9PEZI|nr:hypothetical protein LTS18_003846 [Coniosporium uncinatum]
MGQRTDFLDIQGEHDASDDTTDTSALQHVLDNSPLIALEDLKSDMARHESFEDMLGIVHEASNPHSAADDVLKIWSLVARDELEHWQKELETVSQHYSYSSARHRREEHQVRVNKLSALLVGLKQHRQSLSDYLVFRAQNSSALDATWTWEIGDDMPTLPRTDLTVIEPSSNSFSVPNEYVCPISQELLEDPVTAADGMTYERSAIERWPQIRKTSPMTGLALTDIDLRHNG